jgi:hypothetical protein
MSGLKLKIVPLFPSQVLGGPGIDVVKQNGNFSIDLDYSEFPQVSALPATATYALIYDPISGQYAQAPVSLFAGAGGIPATIPPLMDGTAAVGVGTRYAREDHIHPFDTSRAPAMFLQAGTGAVARTVQDKDRDIVSVKDFGAVGDGTADDTTAMQAAFAAAHIVYLPPGKYRLTANIRKTFSASAIEAFTLIGAGSDNTILFWPNANGGMVFDYQNGWNNSVSLSDFSCTTAQPGNSVAINLSSSVYNASPANAAPNNISRVTFRGDDGYFSTTNYWQIGIAVNNVSSINVNSVYVSGLSQPSRGGSGITMAGLPASSGWAVVLNITDSIFNNLANGFLYGAWAQGITIDRSQFNGCNNAISVVSGATALDQLVVTNSQFALISGQTALSANSAVSDMQFSHNYFIITQSNITALTLGAANNLIVADNWFTAQNPTNTTAIDINGIVAATAATITGNQFYGFTTAINLRASTINTLVNGNTFINNATPITNSGTANTIVNNPGYNPVGFASAAAPASGSPFTNGASPATCYITATGGISQIQFGASGILASAIAANANFTVEMGPHESFTPTYTGTLQILRYTH